VIKLAVISAARRCCHSSSETAISLIRDDVRTPTAAAGVQAASANTRHIKNCPPRVLRQIISPWSSVVRSSFLRAGPGLTDGPSVRPSVTL